MMDNQIWRRMEGEGLHELRLYLLFLALGPRRSLPKLRRWAKELGISASPDEIAALASRFRWRERARAFDRTHAQEPAQSPMDRYRSIIREWGDYQKLQIYQATLPLLEEQIQAEQLSPRDLIQIAEFCEPALEAPSSKRGTYYSQLYQLAQLLGIEEAFASRFGGDDE